jgi:NTE family protein
MNYDSFDNKYSQKRMVFFWDIQSFLLSSDYTNTFNPFSIAKTDFGFATILITPHLKFKQRLDFHLEMIVLAFNFVLGGYGYNQINNFRHFMAMIFKCSS